MEHQCALVEKGGKCCEGSAGPGSMRCVMTSIFGVLVIAGLIAMIVLQAKTLKVLKGSKKK